MSYNTEGMMLRVEAIRRIVMEHYEPGRRDRCYKAVWEKYVRPRYGICYRTFLHYLELRPGQIAGRPTGIRARALHGRTDRETARARNTAGAERRPARKVESRPPEAFRGKREAGGYASARRNKP